MGIYRHAHHAAHARPESREEQLNNPRSPAALLRDHLELLETQSHVSQTRVPVSGKRARIPVHPSVGLTGPFTSPIHGVSTRLIAIGFGPDGEPFSIGEATVSSPGGVRRGYFVSRPPSEASPQTALLGVIGSGFPVEVQEAPTRRRERIVNPWSIALSEDQDGQLIVEEVNADEQDPPAVVFTSTSPAMHQAPMKTEFWAPDPAELAYAVKHQAAGVGDTALMGIVTSSLVDTTARLHRVQ